MLPRPLVQFCSAPLVHFHTALDKEAGTKATETLEDALETIRHLVFVEPDTDKDRRLRAALDEMAEETPDGRVVPWSGHRRQSLVRWQPALS